MDVYSYSIFLFEVVCLCSGSGGRFVKEQFLRNPVNKRAKEWRPEIPDNMEHTLIVKLIEDAWHADASTRLDFKDLVERLEMITVLDEGVTMKTSTFALSGSCSK